MEFSFFGQHNVTSALPHYAVAQYVQAEFLPVYQQQLKDMIIGQVDKEGPARDRPLTGLKVVVNAGNGMGGFLAETLSEVNVVGSWILRLRVKRPGKNW